MELFPGIELIDVDSDFESMMPDIEDMAAIKDFALKWDKNIPDFQTIGHFGVVNFDRVEKINELDGMDILLNKISENCNNIFKQPAGDYANKNYIKAELFNLFVFSKFEQETRDRYFYEDFVSKNFYRVSMKYFINDDYEWEGLYFPRFDLKVKPKKNQLLIYPSNYIYGVVEKPVLSGTRYQISTWF